MEPNPGAVQSLHGEDAYRAIVESAPDALVVVDADGRIALVNAQTEALFGWEREDLVGRPIEVLIPERHRHRHEGHRLGYAADPVPRPMGEGLELYGRRADGRELPVDVSLSPIEVDGERRIVAAVRDLTAHREAERRLAGLGLIVESSQDAIFSIDLSGCVATWNRSAERLCGHRAPDIVGRSATELYPPPRRAEEAGVLAHVLAGERMERRETELVRSDGMVVPVSISLSPIVTRPGAIEGISVIARDVTEQKITQEMLVEIRSRLDEAQALGHLGLWAWHRDTGTVEWSEQLFDIFGVAPAAFDGTVEGHLAVVEPGHRQRIRHALEEAVTSGGGFAEEYPVRRPDGALRWVAVRGDVVNDVFGRPSGLRGICQDLTDRHLVEEATRTALEAERAAVEKLREADALKDEFLAVVSHELRTPLTGILGFSQLLSSDLDPDQRDDFAGRVQRHAALMLDLVEQLLDFSRLEAGRVRLEPAPLPLADAVARAVDEVQSALVDHRVEVVVAPEVSAWADADGLHRILVNLLTNAAKFSPVGSEVTVSARTEGDQVVCEVADRGEGIPAEALPRLFDRFYQVPSGRRPGRRGSGLGLAIVKRYVELHGGRVWAASEEGGGTTLSFSLPRVPEAS